MKKYLNQLPVLLCFLIAVAFSFKSFREPDLWWQIRTGEWIIENAQIPKQDIFSYTYERTKWINVKWGFEVLAAVISNAAGPESVFILQAFVSVILVFLLLQISKLLQLSAASSAFRLSFFAPVITVPFTITLSLVAMEYRIIGRPEMLSHLFTAVFLFFLIQHRNEDSSKIFWLIPLQIIWANFHEAFGIGIVITTIFVVGNWLEFLLSKKQILKPVPTMPKRISLLLLALVASVLINPNGLSLLAQPLNILGQVYENKFSTELFDFTQPEYWQWNVYWVVGLVVIGVAGVLVHYRSVKTKENRIKLWLTDFGVGYLITLVAFTYLAMTAYRNIVFLVIVFFPLLLLGLDALLTKVTLLKKKQTVFLGGLSAVLFVVYLLIVSNQYYKLSKSRDRFGLEVISTYNPTGAADFVKKNNLQGKCFSDYLTSSYLLWKLQPDFKTFIDLRDLDVFPTEHFNLFSEAVTFPESFEKLDAQHQFNYVVLYRPLFANLHDYLYNRSNFQLAFADPIAEVYTRKEAFVEPATVSFEKMKPVPVSFFAFVLNKLLNPFYTPLDYSTIDQDLLEAAFYVSVGQFEKAEKSALKASTNNLENFRGFQMLGEIYYNRALSSTDATIKSQWLSAAINNFRQSLNLKSDLAVSYLGLGAVYYQLQNYPLALENLEQCIRYEKTNIGAHNLAAECCKLLASSNPSMAEIFLRQAISFYQKSDKLNPDNPQIMLNLGFLYFRLNDCASSSKYLLKLKGYEGLTPQDKKSLEDCLQKCGH